ncbi:MAG: tetratricopeptide repeat-containing glycosyltransferase family protein [Leptolyngbyaceae cyanobacterium bins.59]|nr:tetratricopeptide repeat-containing glycosyltransferase family protein [Leptolyngbyaceae cyanobacterium bins.59]
MPSGPEAFEEAVSLAEAASNQGNLLEAVTYYRKALTLQPERADLWKTLGNLLKQAGDLEAAIDAYQQAVTVQPDYWTAYFNIGVVWQQQEAFDRAIDAYQQALQWNPNDLDIYVNLGNCYEALNRFSEAIAAYNKILTSPSHVAAFNHADWCKLGFLFESALQFDKAEEFYQRSLALDPNFFDTRQNRALLLLRLGNFEEGWQANECRWDGGNLAPRHFRQPQWDGSPLQGRRILLHIEQGLGDTIQFIRYAPLLAQQGGRVFFQCHPLLLDLLKCVEGIDYIFPLAVDQPLPEYDVHAPLMSLPFLMGTTLETVPAQIPYIHFTEPRFQLEQPSGTTLKVGIAWAGNSNYKRDQFRSTSLKFFQPLFEVSPTITFYSLQKGPASQDIASLPASVQLVDLGNQFQDFTDTASAILQLNLVISTDTSIVHAAGALGKPVWLLLDQLGDWRWLVGREDSPWYPTVRIFRQTQLGDWKPLFEQVAAALQDFKKNRDSRY